jgi:hypothetical protein
MRDEWLISLGGPYKVDQWEGAILLLGNESGGWTGGGIIAERPHGDDTRVLVPNPTGTGFSEVTLGAVTPWARVAVHWLAGISEKQRKAIVTAARGLTVPAAAPASLLLAAYAATGGGVALEVADQTLEEIELSRTGITMTRTERAPREVPKAPIAKTTADDVKSKIDAAITAMDAKASLHRRAEVLAVLRRARDHVERFGTGLTNRPDATEYPEERDLSLVLSALLGPTPTPPKVPGYATASDIWGTHQYEDLDPRWVAAVANRIFRPKVRLPNDPIPDIYLPPGKNVIAIAGDWGTGNRSSAEIGDQIRLLNPDVTIHLGDVYYSGTAEEERQNFVDPWPTGSHSSFALNSNHEMYSGGYGYAHVALASPKFAWQNGRSYFRIRLENWDILALDSAYDAESFLYSNGNLGAAQQRWLRACAKEARDKGKKIILLSHHDGHNRSCTPTQPLWGQVQDCLGGPPAFWYWGHEHAGIAFKRFAYGDAGCRTRCVGHGGIPYGLDPKTDLMDWTENEIAPDGDTHERGRNGFVVLEIDGEAFEERFVDEYGGVRWRNDKTG